MLSNLLHRFIRPPRPYAFPGRIEVCPPALLQGPAFAVLGWRSALRDWLNTGWGASSGDAPEEPHPGRRGSVEPRLRLVRDDFLQALEDIRIEQAGPLQVRIEVARSLREFWHLRPEVFNLVALHSSQAQAQSRLDRLNRHFPTRSPRSGFAPLA